MKEQEIQKALDGVFDEAVVFRGFTDYLRDYEMIVHVHAATGSDRKPHWLRYLFTHCVSAQAQTTQRCRYEKQSMDERLIDYTTKVDLEGYVWGVKSHCLYPGGKVQPNSSTAQRWRAAVVIDFHEIVIETNAHRLTLICADIDADRDRPDDGSEPGAQRERGLRSSTSVSRSEGAYEPSGRRDGGVRRRLTEPSSYALRCHHARGPAWNAIRGFNVGASSRSTPSTV